MQVLPISQASQPQVQAREDNVREAAMDFEALLISQMLAAFRAEAANGCFNSADDSSSATMLEYAGQHLAQVISRQGGLGLSQLILHGLSQSADSSREAEGAQPGLVHRDPRQSASGGRSVVPASAQLLPGAR